MGASSAWSWRAPVAVAFALAALACGSFGSADGPAGSGAPGGPDATADGADAGGDGGGGDGGGGGDDGGRWCATRPGNSPCFDFDGPGDPWAGWTFNEAIGGGTLSKSDVSPRSRPFALFSQVPAASVDRNAHVVFTNVPSRTMVAIETDVAPDQIGNDQPAQLLEIFQDQRYLELYVRAGTTFLHEYEGGNFKDHAISPAFLPNQWYRVRVEVSLTTRTATFSVAGALSAPVALTRPWQEKPVSVGLGLGNINGSAQAWSARYDNVVIESR